MAEQICTSSHTSIPTERYFELTELEAEIKSLHMDGEATAKDTLNRILAERMSRAERIADLERQLQAIGLDRDVWRDDCKELDAIRALVNQYDRKPQSITSLAGGIDWMRAQIDLAQIEIENLKFQLKEAQCGCEADAVARQTSAHIVEAIDQIGIRNEFKAGIALGKALTELEKLEG